jgi:hypothetical protein
MSEQMSAAEAKNRIDAAWNDWISAIESVPKSRWSESGVCGEWSMKDLLGHVAVWDALTIQYLELVAKGDKPEGIDWEAINAKEAAERTSLTVAEQRSEMEKMHSAMLVYLSTVTGMDLAVIGVNTWDHYPEHTAHVIEWR